MIEKPKAAVCWCPACDEGWVMAVTIQPMDMQGRLCQECEAFWHPQQMIAEEEFTQLSALLKQNQSAIEDISVEIRQGIV